MRDYLQKPLPIKTPPLYISLSISRNFVHTTYICNTVCVCTLTYSVYLCPQLYCICVVDISISISLSACPQLYIPARQWCLLCGLCADLWADRHYCGATQTARTRTLSLLQTHCQDKVAERAGPEKGNTTISLLSF